MLYSRFVGFILGCLLLVGIGLSLKVNASTWVPIKHRSLLIFTPKPGLDSVQVESFQYGANATVALNGFGATSAIYYQPRQWSNGSYTAPNPEHWLCHDKTTINNDTLQFGLDSGRYQVDVIAVMGKTACDINAFKAGALISSETYTTSEFMLINHQKLDHLKEGVASLFCAKTPKLMPKAI